MKKLALTTLLAAGILLSGCQAPGEQSPEVTSVQTQAALQTAGGTGASAHPRRGAGEVHPGGIPLHHRQSAY